MKSSVSNDYKNEKEKRNLYYCLHIWLCHNFVYTYNTHTHFYKQVSFFCSVCQIDERKQDDFILGVGAGFVNYIS
jgi:hypothetical protein